MKAAIVGQRVLLLLLLLLLLALCATTPHQCNAALPCCWAAFGCCAEEAEAARGAFKLKCMAGHSVDNNGFWLLGLHVCR